MLFVKLVPITPFGKSQIYDVAFAILGTVYVIAFCPRHTFVVPEIIPALAGSSWLTDKVAESVIKLPPDVNTHR